VAEVTWPEPNSDRIARPRPRDVYGDFPCFRPQLLQGDKGHRACSAAWQSDTAFGTDFRFSNSRRATDGRKIAGHAATDDAAAICALDRE
jgi:hypothetical protein